jgi:hypothetical protein
MDSIQDFPLDIKLVIASSNEDAWYILWRYDQAFSRHTNTPYYVRLYTKLFTTIERTNGDIIYTLFGKIHRLDGPALIVSSGLLYGVNNQGYVVNVWESEYDGEDCYECWYIAGKYIDDPAVYSLDKY